jgi:cellobiose phosphorylase
MQYGYFDDNRKEYVITRPDTPKSWSNYLGDIRYGAIITQNAGGYSFFRSSVQGRFLRLSFNKIPLDQPGRYLYLHDRENKDFWSTSWQPVGKSLDTYKSECRHGSAYTIITSEYDRIKTETLYFVPLGKQFEVWHVRIINSSIRRRSLRAFTYVEFASNWNMNDDQNNLQYTQYIIQTAYKNGFVDHSNNPYMPEDPKHFQNKDQCRHSFIGVVGVPVSGFDSDRDRFIGNYHTYANPVSVMAGKCQNTITQGDNGCGVLQVDLDLAPGATIEFTVVLGIGKADSEGLIAAQTVATPEKVQAEFQKLTNYWHSRIEGLTAQTPDPAFNSMINMWNPFNNLITYAWSRAASLIYSGERDGMGYRDTIQDMLGIVHNIPEEIVERLELMLTGQNANGGAMPVVKPFDHHPGNEKPTPENEFRSDDCLWLFNTVPAYVKETGNMDYYNKILPYADKEEGTVLDHLRRAIQFNLNRRGKNNLPCGLKADWNDCLVLGEKGETVFVAMQLRYALMVYMDICRRLNRLEDEQWAESTMQQLTDDINKTAWDGEWYVRAVKEDGYVFGSRQTDEGKIWLNPQSWAIISGQVSGKKAETIMNAVEKYLATDYGLTLCHPPYEHTEPSVIKAPLFIKGMKENAAIFQHTQGWGIMADCILGHGNRAYKNYRNYLPAAYNDRAEIRQIEPYVYAQTTCSNYNMRAGQSRCPWLSGTASWAYYTAAQYILGIRPDYDGLTIDPCIPQWESFTVNRRFRGKTMRIKVENPDKVEKGVKFVIINGITVKGNTIPFHLMKEINNVRVLMG